MTTMTTKEEHPLIRKARLDMEESRRKSDKARDEFFKVLRSQGTIIIVITILWFMFLSLMK